MGQERLASSACARTCPRWARPPCLPASCPTPVLSPFQGLRTGRGGSQDSTLPLQQGGRDVHPSPRRGLRGGNPSSPFSRRRKTGALLRARPPTPGLGASGAGPFGLGLRLGSPGGRLSPRAHCGLEHGAGLGPDALELAEYPDVGQSTFQALNADVGVLARIPSVMTNIAFLGDAARPDAQVTGVQPERPLLAPDAQARPTAQTPAAMHQAFPPAGERPHLGQAFPIGS